MKISSTFILQVAISVIGLIVLALCIFVLPLGITSDKTGYYRPILSGMYVSAIPFFYGLFHGMKLLSYITRDQAFSEPPVIALKKIKYAALTVTGLYVAGMPYIYYAADRDDAPGVVLGGLIVIFASFVIAVAAGVFQSLLSNAIDFKSENDLTV